jgi:uncharacterized protein (DUF849 family)
MVAPNGARKSKQDHPCLPISIEEIVRTAIDCQQAGAHALHAHIRDKDGNHSLDAELYKELLAALTQHAPSLKVQITTEAVSRYTPTEQRLLVKRVQPRAVSVSLKEMLSDNNIQASKAFYHWVNDAQIDLQHILYSHTELTLLDSLIKKGVVPQSHLSILFVLGRYKSQTSSTPNDLTPFLQARHKSHYLQQSRFMVCAFGEQEIPCLVAGVKAGGDCRIGFENNLLNATATPAKNNAERVLLLNQSLGRNLQP